ncbi:hypothetical protein MRB53_037691 [Persea americana]|nr:hypothetical protein MRB53_037691 [Persea americana]
MEGCRGCLALFPSLVPDASLLNQDLNVLALLSTTSHQQRVLRLMTDAGLLLPSCADALWDRRSEVVHAFRDTDRYLFKFSSFQVDCDKLSNHD